MFGLLKEAQNETDNVERDIENMSVYGTTGNEGQSCLNFHTHHHDSTGGDFTWHSDVVEQSKFQLNNFG